MSAAKDTADSTDASTKDLEDDIAKTRSEMSKTLGELHGKLNPGVLKDQVLDQFHEAKESLKTELIGAKESIKADLKAELEVVKHGLRTELNDAKNEFREATIGRVETMVQSAQDTVTDTSRSLLQVLSDNPVPTAIVGLGLGWLLINARARSRGASQSRSYSNGGYANDRAFGGRVEDYAQQAVGSLQQGAKRVVQSVTSQAGTLVHQADDATQDTRAQATRFVHDAQDAVGNAAHQIGDQVGQLAHQVGDRAGQAAHQASDLANQASTSAMTLARNARQQAGQWEGIVERALRENPLPAGAVALAIGLAVGLAIPSTKIEDDYLGDTRDSVLEGAEAFAQQEIGVLETAATKLVGGEKNEDKDDGKRLSQSQPA